MDADPALLAFLEAQRAEYRCALPGRLEALEGLWQQASAAADAQALHDLERCAHRIAGSAATFGLPALGERARAFELALEARAGMPRGLDATEVRRHYRALREQLRAAIG